MPTDALMKAIHEHPFRPAGVKVSPDLWQELHQRGQITRPRGFIEGVIDSGIDFPVIDKTIFVEIDFDLDDLEFSLPSEPKK